MIKKLLLTVVSILCCTQAYTKEDWQLVWNDEFDYEGAPDDKKWSFDTEGNNWDWGNAEAQNYTPADKKNAWVSDGNLIIEARKEEYTWPGDNQTRQYTSARLRTLGKGDWTYGKVEVRALLPTGRGTWPAIWMLPSDNIYGAWPSSGELDIMENVGYDPNKIHCNIHTEAYNHTLGTNKGNTVSTTAPSENWHVYSMEWDAEKVIFFLDGDQVFRFDNEHISYKEWPYDQNFHLLLNLAVGGGWGGTEGIDDDIFPQRMLVDYVRVYQMEDVAEMPADGHITATTSLEEKIFQGDVATLKIDTAGTGRLLYPYLYRIVVEERIGDETHEIDNHIYMMYVKNGVICYKVSPKSSAVYTTKIYYHEGEGDDEQYIELENKLEVLPKDSLSTADAIEGSCKAIVYPTVATNELYVNKGMENYSYAIYSANGVKLLEGKVEADIAINIGNLMRGNYFIVIDKKALPFFKE